MKREGGEESSSIAFSRDKRWKMERRIEMMNDCVLDREERRKEMNGLSSVQSKHSGGEEGKWRLRCRE